MFERLRSHTDSLHRDKSQLLDAWIDCPLVQCKLKKNHFDANFFKERFASAIIDYALQTIEDDSRLGNCPVVGTMLFLFKKRDIPLNDVFLICVQLKNTLLAYLCDKGLLDHALLDEACLLMDMNFDGVMKTYLALYYGCEERRASRNCDHLKKTRHLREREDPAPKETLDLAREQTQKEEPPVQKSPNTQPIQEDTPPRTVVVDLNNLDSMHLTEEKKVTAQQFVAEFEFDHDLLDDLHEYENSLFDVLHEDDALTQKMIVVAAETFAQYGKLLGNTYEFIELSYSLNALTMLLQHLSVGDLDAGQCKRLKLYTENVTHDLQSWKEKVFITQEALDVHYLDASLLSSCAQIEQVLSPVEEDDDEEAFELF